MMSAQLSQETLKASFHALSEAMWSDVRQGYISTAQYRLEHLTALADMIEDDWFSGRIPSYEETLEEVIGNHVDIYT